MIYQTKEEMLKTLGSNIRALRLSYNISQQAAAERSGISLKAVRNIEDGKNASTLSLLALCHTLNAVDWILTVAPPHIDPAAFERRDPMKPRQRAMPKRKGEKNG